MSSIVTKQQLVLFVGKEFGNIVVKMFEKKTMRIKLMYSIGHRNKMAGRCLYYFV